MRKRIVLLLSVLLLILPTATFASGPPYDENSPEYKDVSSLFVCPECNTVGAELNDRFKAEILDLMNEGYTKEEIKDYFIGVYGESILAAPEASGFNILVWTLPFIVIGIAGIGIILFIRNSVKRSKEMPEE